jgi:hypothetical protein
MTTTLLLLSDERNNVPFATWTPPAGGRRF